MDFYYMKSSSIENHKTKLRRVSIVEGMTAVNLIHKIKQIPNFCRDEVSIQTKTLIGFIKNDSIIGSSNNNNITVYSLSNNKIVGVINFTIETNNIHINALCVPNARSGIGKKLITKVIIFSKENNINIIKLVCYGNVHKYYQILGFKITSSREVMQHSLSDSDSDSDSDGDGDSDTLTEYRMSMNVAFDFENMYFEDDEEDAVATPNTNDFEKGGKKSKKSMKSMKSKKIMKSMKSKKSMKSMKSKKSKKSKKNKITNKSKITSK